MPSLTSKRVGRTAGSSATRDQTPVIQRRLCDQRVYDSARQLGLSGVLARVISQRGLSPAAVRSTLNPALSELADEAALADVDLAAQRLAAAVITNEHIGIQTDYDMDGLGAHATFITTLTDS